MKFNIEQICEGLLAGTITLKKAIEYLKAHEEMDTNHDQ